MTLLLSVLQIQLMLSSDGFNMQKSQTNIPLSGSLKLLTEACLMLRILLTIEKVEGLLTVLGFLGVLLDTIWMEAQLLEEKLTRIWATIREWVGKKKATNRETLSLGGLLQHAAKVVCPGCTFVHRMNSVAARVPELDCYTR